MGFEEAKTSRKTGGGVFGTGTNHNSHDDGTDRWDSSNGTARLGEPSRQQIPQAQGHGQHAQLQQPQQEQQVHQSSSSTSDFFDFDLAGPSFSNTSNTNNNSNNHDDSRDRNSTKRQHETQSTSPDWTMQGDQDDGGTGIGVGFMSNSHNNAMGMDGLDAEVGQELQRQVCSTVKVVVIVKRW
jgi:hypothetical protein